MTDCVLYPPEVAGAAAQPQKSQQTARMWHRLAMFYHIPKPLSLKVINRLENCEHVQKCYAIFVTTVPIYELVAQLCQSCLSDPHPTPHLPKQNESHHSSMHCTRPVFSTHFYHHSHTCTSAHSTLCLSKFRMAYWLWHANISLNHFLFCM